MSKLGPNTLCCHQHFLNPLGHGVHQSFTGCHWSPLPLLHDDIKELLHLALFHLPFENAPQITFTLSCFSKAVVVLEACLGSLSCWNTALRPSLRSERIMLCSIWYSVRRVVWALTGWPPCVSKHRRINRHFKMKAQTLTLNLHILMATYLFNYCGYSISVPKE